MNLRGLPCKWAHLSVVGAWEARVEHSADADGADLVRLNHVGVGDGGAEQHLLRNPGLRAGGVLLVKAPARQVGDALGYVGMLHPPSLPPWSTSTFLRRHALCLAVHQLQLHHFRISIIQQKSSCT